MSLSNKLHAFFAAVVFLTFHDDLMHYLCGKPAGSRLALYLVAKQGRRYVMHFCFKLILSFILGLPSLTYAGKLQSYCFMNENDMEVSGGKNINEKLPIASVSKVFTSLSVLSTVSAKARLQTQFFVTPVSGGIFDVHIKGSRDPYFQRSSMHMLISKLNEMGVRKIRTLTFDENFKYLHNSNQINTAGRGRYYNPVTGKAVIDAPSGDFVRLLLLQSRLVLVDYEKSKKEAASNNIIFVEKPVFAPEKIEQVRSTFEPPANSKRGSIPSMEMIDIIKYMNWNSNNHVANSLFMIAGGKARTDALFFDNFKFNPNQISFVNGSGQNADNAGRSYTEASCAAVVRTVKGLKKILEKQNMKLQDAVAVGGGDIGSTIDAGVYKKYLAPKTVIAKTGTVGVAITLAGMASSKKGNFFFMFSVEPRQAPGRLRVAAASRWRENEAARCRAIIGQKLAERIDLMDAGYPLSFELKDEAARRKFYAGKKISDRGLAFEYPNRKYDVINFEDSGDENAPELADEVAAVAAQVAGNLIPLTTPSK